MNQLLKIGVFYDGNYLSNVSNYYYFQHHRKTRINVEGLHQFVRHQVAKEEGVALNLCRITEAHYFRGRLNAADAKELNKLYPDRVIDDMLMQQGMQSHYLPLVTKKDGYKEEKGIEVALCLEAFEKAMEDKIDVFVLVACDTEYMALMTKLNRMGIRTMVLAWNFQYTDDFGYERGILPSHDLMRNITYPLLMHEIVDSTDREVAHLMDQVFRPFEVKATLKTTVFDEVSKTSTIVNLNKEKGYGFIEYYPDNIFFHFSQMAEGEDYDMLQEGDTIEFIIGTNERDGKKMAKNIRKVSAEKVEY